MINITDEREGVVEVHDIMGLVDDLKTVQRLMQKVGAIWASIDDDGAPRVQMREGSFDAAFKGRRATEVEHGVESVRVTVLVDGVEFLALREREERVQEVIL